MLRAAVALAAVALAGSLPSTAAAATGHVLDPVDTAGPLDVAAASAHVRPQRTRRARRNVLVLRVRTYAPWRPRDLARAGSVALNGFSFEFVNRNRVSCFDIELGREGTLSGQVIRSCLVPRFGEIGRPVRVRHPGPRLAEAVVPLRLLGRRAAHMRWRAVSSFEASGHPTCPPPEYTPPEHDYGTCTDRTAWARIRR